MVFATHSRRGVKTTRVFFPVNAAKISLCLQNALETELTGNGFFRAVVPDAIANQLGFLESKPPLACHADLLHRSIPSDFLNVVEASQAYVPL